jgi:hypothetical protein
MVTSYRCRFQSRYSLVRFLLLLKVLSGASRFCPVLVLLTEWSASLHLPRRLLTSRLHSFSVGHLGSSTGLAVGDQEAS